MQANRKDYGTHHQGRSEYSARKKDCEDSLLSEEVKSSLLRSRRGGGLLGRGSLAVALGVVDLAEHPVHLRQRILVERVTEPVEEALLLAPVGRGPAHQRRVAGDGDSHGGNAHCHRHRCRRTRGIETKCARLGRKKIVELSDCAVARRRRAVK